MRRIPASAALMGLLATLIAPATALATPQTLVSGQTLTLPLTEASDGPALTFQIKKATLKGSAYQATAAVKGETREERKARGDQVVLDNIEGRNLVKFARFAADELRNRYAEKAAPVKVTVVFEEGLAVDQGGLMGDALKAGFTLGLAAPATTPVWFNSHMEFLIEIDGAAPQTVVCDGKELGRVARYPKKNDPHGHDEMDRMQDVGRKACFNGVVARLNGEAPPAAATPTAQ